MFRATQRQLKNLALASEIKRGKGFFELNRKLDSLSLAHSSTLWKCGREVLYTQLQYNNKRDRKREKTHSNYFFDLKAKLHLLGRDKLNKLYCIWRDYWLNLSLLLNSPFSPCHFFMNVARIWLVVGGSEVLVRSMELSNFWSSYWQTTFFIPDSPSF